MLTMSQFADKLGLTRQRVHQLNKEGRISPKPKKYGKYFLVVQHAKVIKALTTVK